MPNGHKYLVNDKEKPGVTSILSILNKPGLPQWAANQVVESIQKISDPFLKEEGMKAWVVTEFDLKRARVAFNNSRDDSALVGKKVHSWLENHVKNQIKGIDEKEKYSLDMKASIETFLEWEEAHNPTYVFSERIIYSENGDYCGTCDVGLILDGKRVILDFKTGKPEKQYDTRLRRYTGKKRAYSTVFMQDALYDLAIEEEDGIKADMYGALYLSTNGDLLFSVTEETDAFRRAAKAVVNLHKALQIINNVNKWT